MALASAPKQTRQEVTAAARELPSRQTVSTTSHAVSTPDAQPGCRTMNSLGVSPTLFNRQALYAPGDEPVFVTEGAFDALSVIEAGRQCGCAQ